MRRIAIAAALLAAAATTPADELQVARQRALGLLNRSTTLAQRASQSLRLAEPRADVFAALLRLHPEDGSAIGVFDLDGRRVAWVGSPIDPRRLPEVDPSRRSRFVAATRSRAALVVTEKSPGGFVLVSTPLLETRRGDGDEVSIVDVLDPSRLLQLNYAEHGGVASGDHAGEMVAALDVPFARVTPHRPEAHQQTPPSPRIELKWIVLLSLSLGFSALGHGLTVRRLALSRAAALTLVCLSSALSVTAFVTEVAARKAERDAVALEIESVLRAHVGPLQAILAATEHVIDRAQLFESSPAGRFGTEELAFDLWSDSALAQPFLPSFVEVLDRSGSVVSRYARNIPAGPKPLLPTDADWTRSKTSMNVGDLAQAEGVVSERLLISEGELLGAVRIGAVSDLPLALRQLGELRGFKFLGVRDPSGAVVRGAAPLGRSNPAGSLGVRIDVSVLENKYVFEIDRAGATIGRAAGLTVLGQGIGLGVIAFVIGAWLGNPKTVRDLMAGLLRRHSFRLFAAFLALSGLSLSLFQTLVRDFVAQRLVTETETEARRIAAIARKSLSDLSAFQEAEVLGPLTISDAATSWVAALVSNDLELFDESGELVATNVREDVDAGLLSRLAPSDAYRALVLGNDDMMFHRPEGALVPSAVSARLPLAAGRRGLVRVSLQNREVQVASVLRDLDARMRLASLSLLAVATVLAFVLARRISGPVLEMTIASRRIAQGDLSVRVPVRTGDEVGELAQSFNTMAHDLARQQHEIERRERLAAWADMAAQVAHEVKNPLTPIQLSAEHLQRAYRASGLSSEVFDSVVTVCTRTILESVTKLRDIASEFAAFVRAPAERRQLVDLASLTESVTEPYQAVLPEGLTLSTRTEAFCRVLGEAKLIERAIRNLLENAMQAVAGRGRISVVCARAGGFAEITIDDTGPGFDEETRARLFEPFFSTKTQGSGLGLALVRKVAEDLGGGASLERVGVLTRAVLRLPLAPAE